MAQGKPKRYSDEHLKLLEAGVVVYPGDKATIDNMRSQGVWKDGPVVTWEQFWEVSDKDSVDPAANLRDKRPRLEGDPFSQPLSIEERRMVDPTWAYPGHVRLGAPGPVTPGDPRPVPTPTSPNMDAEYTGLLSPAPQPYRDESAGLGVDTGYVPGMRRSISPQGTRANVDDSFDWQVRGVDPNKPWSGEMSAAERRRDELIALQKIQAKRDRQIAEAKAKQEAMVSGQAAPTITETITQVDDDSIPDKRVIKKDYKPDFKRFTPGQDRGMVDPNQAYPGSVRFGAPGPVTPGRQFPTEREDKSILDRISEFGGALNLPSAKNIWDFGGVLDAPSASDIVGGVGDFLTRKTAVADPRSLGATQETLREDEQIGSGIIPYPVPTGQDDPSGAPYGGKLETGSSDYEIRRLIEEGKIAARTGARGPTQETLREDEQIGLVTPPTAARVETTPERINPVSLKERYPTVEDYIAQIEENKAARVEGREAENRSGIPLTLGGLDASSFGLDATGMIDEALKGAEEGADVEEVLGDEGAGLLSFEEKHAPNFGVEPEDTRLPPQLRKDETKPDPEKSEVGGQDVRDAPPAVRAELERQWGKWAYNPKERREKFMSQLNAIYKKGAWLDAIAALTGGRSRSAQYIERAVGKLEAMTKFDQEERVYNIWRDVYFDKDGNYNAPRSKREAAELARRLYPSPAETKAIYGWAEEGEDLQQWYRRVDGKLEVTTTEGKKKRPPQGDTDEDWIMGTPSDRAPAARTWTNWTDGKMTIYLPAGTSPADKGLVEGDWRKGSASESSGWSPTWKKEIGMLEKIAITDREEAVAQAISALRDEKYSHLYEGQEDRKEAAEHWIDEILANYAARGNIGIMEAETGNNIVVIGAVD